MQKPTDFQEFSCSQCLQNDSLDFDFTMAFQPIVNLAAGTIFGYEALVRGLNNESAFSVIEQVNEGNRYRFDQSCRVKAIALAARLGISSCVSINFLPNAVYRPELCIRTTLEAARVYNFPPENILFEITEVEKVKSNDHLKEVVTYYNELGFRTALDDFGAGYSGLNLLADFQTDLLKFDMALIRDIDKDKVRQTIVLHMIRMCFDLGITPLAEGVETMQELEVLRKMGVALFQGYLFARPGFECLPSVDFSGLG